MNCEELQIDDWVEYNGLNRKVKEISGFDNEVYLTMDECVDCTEVNPLPLTPEILEKNGFEKKSNYQWKYRDNSCTIEISIAPNIEIEGELLGPSPINVKIEGALFILDGTDDWYIHELQHALRLCGIEKEIVL